MLALVVLVCVQSMGRGYISSVSNSVSTFPPREGALRGTAFRKPSQSSVKDMPKAASSVMESAEVLMLLLVGHTILSTIQGLLTALLLKTVYLGLFLLCAPLLGTFVIHCIAAQDQPRDLEKGVAEAQGTLLYGPFNTLEISKPPAEERLVEVLRAPASTGEGRRTRKDSRLSRGKGGKSVSTRDVPMVSLEDWLMSEKLPDYYSDQLSPISDLLASGGMGIVPTDAQPSMVTPISSQHGTKRLYKMQGETISSLPPLTLLCTDLTMASQWLEISALPRRWFQLLKGMVPGPYTFIVRATKQAPRVLMEHKSRSHLWKKRELGLRIPDNSVVNHLTAELGEPLVSSSVDALHFPKLQQLDFYVSVEGQGHVEEEPLTTVIDLTKHQPVLVRQGLGDPSPFCG